MIAAESNISRPMLVGFAYSRVDSASEISEQPSADPQRDIYRHPDAMGKPSVSFDQFKDMYALGTLLLKIGEWTSLRGITAKLVEVNDMHTTTRNLAMVRPFLLSEGPPSPLASLKFRMDDVYANVTRMLLSREGPALSEKPTTSLQEHDADTLEVAVRLLRQCHI